MQTTVVFFCGFDLSTMGATDTVLLVAAEEVGWESTVTFTGMTPSWQKCEDVCEYRTSQSVGYDTVVSYDSKVCVVRRTGEVLQCRWSLPFLANYESVNRG